MMSDQIYVQPNKIPKVIHLNNNIIKPSVGSLHPLVVVYGAKSHQVPELLPPFALLIRRDGFLVRPVPFPSHFALFALWNFR